jgi:putative peptidoglycan lipid II flippase
VSEERRLAVSTAAFGAATALSRLAGLLREIVAASLLGSGAAASAFQIAFNVPNLVRSLVADTAISAAFVPVFVELRERGEEREAWRVAATVLWMAAIVLGALSALFVLLAPWLMPLFVLGNEHVSEELVVTLSRWLFPIIALLGMTGVVTGILNSYGIFGVPAMAPVAWNATIVAVLVLFAHDSSPEHAARVYAVGVLLATIVQFAIPLPLLGGHGYGLAFRLGWGNPHVRRVLRLMLPVTIGLGLINFNFTLDLAISTLEAGHTASDLNYAFRLFMLPQGLFSVAVSAVLFPELARVAARHDTAGFAARVSDGARTIVFLLLPAAAVSIVLAEPIVRLIYERGAFSASDTTHVSEALIAFSLGLVVNGLALLLTRGFFALQEPRVPTLVAAGNLVLNAVLDLALYKPFGAAGIALATSIVTLWNSVVLAYVLRRRVGHLHGRRVLRETLLIAVATALSAAAGWAAWRGVDLALGRSLAAQIVSVAAGLAAATAAYLEAGRLLALQDMAVVSLLADRLRGAR